MEGHFELKVVDLFSSAHSLRGYEGNCERIHGHNWKVEVVVSSSKVDERGLCIDFRDLKRFLKDVLGGLDHKNLNEVEPFNRVNPSSENLAAFIFAELKKMIPDDVSLKRVTVWESESASASYIAD
ncbi:MAG: 6-carboxytetrahydropterin synthase QueD [Deltaproteobacteria bacterium]|nr:6-carboxytetrahydropterin synthase QueD [Deltaproteobacteria bacterium]NIS76605.1 6-carboxytetrahydropterin synthase QueD [Deltaproteobacteria bacterium]